MSYARLMPENPKGGTDFLGPSCLTVHLTSGPDASRWLGLPGGGSPLDYASLLLPLNIPEFFRIKHLFQSAERESNLPAVPTLSTPPTPLRRAVVSQGGSSGSSSTSCSELRRGRRGRNPQRGPALLCFLTLSQAAFWMHV